VTGKDSEAGTFNATPTEAIRAREAPPPRVECRGGRQRRRWMAVGSWQRQQCRYPRDYAVTTAQHGTRSVRRSRPRARRQRTSRASSQANQRRAANLPAAKCWRMVCGRTGVYELVALTNSGQNHSDKIQVIVAASSVTSPADVPRCTIVVATHGGHRHGRELKCLVVVDEAYDRSNISVNWYPSSASGVGNTSRQVTVTRSLGGKDPLHKRLMISQRHKRTPDCRVSRRRVTGQSTSARPSYDGQGQRHPPAAARHLAPHHPGSAHCPPSPAVGSTKRGGDSIRLDLLGHCGRAPSGSDLVVRGNAEEQTVLQILDAKEEHTSAYYNCKLENSGGGTVSAEPHRLRRAADGEKPVNNSGCRNSFGRDGPTPAEACNANRAAGAHRHLRETERPIPDRGRARVRHRHRRDARATAPLSFACCDDAREELRGREMDPAWPERIVARTAIEHRVRPVGQPALPSVLGGHTDAKHLSGFGVTADRAKRQCGSSADKRAKDDDAGWVHLPASRIRTETPSERASGFEYLVESLDGGKQSSQLLIRDATFEDEATYNCPSGEQHTTRPSSPSSLDVPVGAEVQPDSNQLPDYSLSDDGMVLNIRLVRNSKHSGTYSCEAVNDFGHRCDAAEAGSPPRLKQAYEKVKYVIKGRSLDLTCKFNGNPTPTLVFRPLRVGQAVMEIRRSQGRFILSEGATRYTGSRRRLLRVHRLLNSVGRQLHSYRVNVLVPPKSTNGTGTDSPLKITAKIGEPLRIGCNVTGKPKPEIQWYFKGQRLSDADAARLGVRVSRESELLIDSIESTHVGLFQCRAFNKGGNVTLNFDLTAIKRPVLEPNLIGSKTVIQGDSMNLLCTVKEGFPRPQIFWWFRGAPAHGQRAGAARGQQVRRRVAVHPGCAQVSARWPWKCQARNEGGVSGFHVTTVIVFDPREASASGADKPDRTGDRGVTISETEMAWPQPANPVAEKWPVDRNRSSKSQVIAEKGKTLVLCAQLAAYPDPEITWYKGGAKVTRGAVSNARPEAGDNLCQADRRRRFISASAQNLKGIASHSIGVTVK
uniref:Ig-like domain-containing protein n=1 Tax=Macrostomum lignano TaxID=282301 RepID=A0A1I8FE86_9PLAT